MKKYTLYTLQNGDSDTDYRDEDTVWVQATENGIDVITIELTRSDLEDLLAGLDQE